MKHQITFFTFFAFFFFIDSQVNAQSVWTGPTSGKIYYNGGNVGIGVSAPNFPLEVERTSSNNNSEYIVAAFNHSGNGGGIYMGYVGDGTAAKEARVRSGGNIPLSLGTSNYRHAIYVEDGNGYVGIGTKTPVLQLDVVGISYLRNAPGVNTEVEQLRIGRNDNNIRYHSIYSKHTGTASSNHLQFRVHGGTSDPTIQTTVMTMTGDGHVGIGTTDTHGYELAVAGGVLAEKVYLEQQPNWPDYVFSSKYNLRSLEETEAFINENHHLPEIPSAQEVESNGYDLGQMNAKLLEKIEELTLYLIDQNNLIKTLQSDVEKLKSTTDN